MPHSKPILAIRVLACVCIAASSLTPPVARAQANAEETVQQSLNMAVQGMFSGAEEKHLGRLGDATAVQLTKLLADKPLRDADIPPIILVTRLSYNFPEGIQDADNRKPRATLYLLRSLSYAAKDPKILGSIEEVTEYVKSQYAAYLRNHPGQ